EILEEALVGFEGTVVLVSHDRRFLETTTTRIVSVRDGVVDIYPGGFRDYVAAHEPKKADDDERKLEAERPRDRGKEEKKRNETARSNVKDQTAKEADDRAKKQAFDQQRQQSREKERRKRRVEELEKAIAAGEKELTEMRAKLKEDPGGNWAKLAEM